MAKEEAAKPVEEAAEPVEEAAQEPGEPALEAPADVGEDADWDEDTAEVPTEVAVKTAAPVETEVESTLPVAPRPKVPKKRGLTGRLLLILVGLAVLGGGGFAAYYFGFRAAAPGEPAKPEGKAPPTGQSAIDPVELAEAALAAEEPNEQEAAQPLVPLEPPRINLLDLMVRGGLLMLPIAARIIIAPTIPATAAP